MGFKRDEVSKLLSRCHRRCCICHRFCGIKIETDHIRPKEQGGDDSIENAIPVCFECHAEIHSYNDKHPRGRKFLPEELQFHKDQWLKICEERPQILMEVTKASGVGPLQALIDELEYNLVVTNKYQLEELGCMYHTSQFDRSIQEGAISILRDELKDSITSTYYEMNTANGIISSLWRHNKLSNNWSKLANDIKNRKRKLIEVINGTINKMIEFLGEKKDVT